MAEETKIPQAQIVKPVINIEDNTSLISSQVERIFSRGVRSDSESIKLLTGIEHNTNKLLSLFGRPVERVREYKKPLSQEQRPQTARARDEKGRFIAVAKEKEKAKVNPLKSVFEKGAEYEPKSLQQGQAQTKSAKNLEIARQKKATRRQEGFFSRLLKRAGFFGKETVGAVGDVTDKTFFEKLAGPIYGTFKELQEAGKEVWDSTKSIGSRIGNIFKGKPGDTANKAKDGRDEKGRFLGGKIKQQPREKKDTSLFKKMLGKLTASEKNSIEKQKFDEEVEANNEKRHKELVKEIDQNGGGGEKSSLLSGLGKGGIAAIIGGLTGGLGIGGLLTAGAGGLLTGAVGIIPAIVAAVLVALAGAAGYGIGKVVNNLIDKAMGEKGAIGSKLYDFFHPKESNNQGIISEKVKTGKVGITNEGLDITDPTKKSGGSRSWRNNNPGNMVYDSFAAKYGAVKGDAKQDSSGLNWAVFPNEEAGKAAIKDKLTTGKNWKDLSLEQTIRKWAPATENNTENYIKQFENAGLGRNSKISDFSDDQFDQFYAVMKRHEGWQAYKDTRKIEGVSAENYLKMKQNFADRKEGKVPTGILPNEIGFNKTNEEIGIGSNKVGGKIGVKPYKEISGLESVKPQTIESPQATSVNTHKATQDQIAKMTASLGDVTKSIDPKRWVNDKVSKDMGFDVNMVPSEIDDITLTLMRYDRI
jgi:hypothetical protein